MPLLTERVVTWEEREESLSDEFVRSSCPNALAWDSVGRLGEIGANAPGRLSVVECIASHLPHYVTPFAILLSPSCHES